MRLGYGRLDTPFGPVESWLELLSVGPGRVYFQAHNRFSATGEVLTASSELRFRTLAELTASLADAGFTIEQVYGDWQRGRFTSTSRIMVFVARRN
ncbi:MAG: hypothetical protein OHK0022_23690 [Roseiflexaceae bacterium]